MGLHLPVVSPNQTPHQHARLDALAASRSPVTGSVNVNDYVKREARDGREGPGMCKGWDLGGEKGGGAR